MFDEVIKAKLAGAVVSSGYLVHIDLLTAPIRLWDGVGTITAGGYEWLGAGGLGSISGLEQAIGGRAPETTFGFSGVDDALRDAFVANFRTEAKGRRIRVALQFLLDEGCKAVGSPYTLATLIMKRPTISLNEDGTADITASAESLYALQNPSQKSLYTDRDQQTRFPGDKGLEFVSTLQNKVLTWPEF